MSASLLKRLVALEQRIASLEAPQPTRIFPAEDTEAIDAYQREHPEARIVVLSTVCARYCDDTCPSPGGLGCRQKMGEPARSWQPREGASCD